ncbi:MAG: SurA N-terminal domain-containing protein [Pseudomonadota bacterium]|nr:SurA N-terminal domain-containing protein [Pseudomonadota bacterium]
MINNLLVAALCLVAATITYADKDSSSEVLLDRVVAVAGGTPVLFSEAQHKVEQGRAVVFSSFPVDNQAPPLQQAMHDLINIHLAQHTLTELGAGIADQEVEQRIEQFLQAQGLSKKELLEFLRTQDKNYDEYRTDFRQQILISKFHGLVISPLIKITDAELRSYFQKKTGKDHALLHLQQIYLPKDQEARSVEAYKELRSGLNFASAIDLYHDQAQAASMPPVRLNDLSATIKASVKDLNKGEFSAPVQTALGFHIFYIKDLSLASDREFKAQKQTLEVELRNSKMLKQTKRWLAAKRAQLGVKVVDYKHAAAPKAQNY